MAEEDEDLFDACIGRFRFLKPYPHYVPPPCYPRIPQRDYRWQIGVKVESSPDMQCKISHAVELPNILGLGPEARWRWQWIPISLMSSVVMKIWPSNQNSSEGAQWGGIATIGGLTAGVSPHARLKVLTPVFGKLAIQPTLELLPAPLLSIKRPFCVGTTKFTLQANLEMNNTRRSTQKPRWSLRVDWHPADVVKMIVQPAKDVALMEYSRLFNLSPGRKGVASALAEVPLKLVLDGAPGLLSTLPQCTRLVSIKASQVIMDKAAKTRVLPTSTYLEASQKIGTNDHISVVPGHWIDPAHELGAPGEREFNMDVANVTERLLIGNGWKVLRPDRDAPNLSWEEYLKWVSKQTSQGTPVLEIHGQGSKADSRGIVVGLIGDVNAPLNKELAKDFGYYKMNWLALGVPKLGGAVLESFNSDEVLQMAPWHRKWSARRLANRIVICIERASHTNRLSRGIIVESGRDELLSSLGSLFSGRKH